MRVRKVASRTAIYLWIIPVAIASAVASALVAATEEVRVTVGTSYTLTPLYVHDGAPRLSDFPKAQLIGLQLPILPLHAIVVRKLHVRSPPVR